MEKIVGQVLREKNFTIACAESCTGGLLTSKLTDVAGSSDYVQGAIVAYSNEIKISALNVREETLKNFGAVSEETAREMATNIRKIFRTDIGISVTGIAGPGGGSKEKPVGTVYVCVCGENKISVKKFNFLGKRIEIKSETVKNALQMLADFLTEL